MSKYKDDIIDAYKEIKEAGFPIRISTPDLFDEMTEEVVPGAEFDTYAVKTDDEDVFQYESLSAEDIILSVPGYKIPFPVTNGCKITNLNTDVTRNIYRVKTVSPEDDAVIVYFIVLRGRA